VRTPYLLLALIGLGGFVNGVTGPLVSAFIPPSCKRSSATGGRRSVSR
jgi:hypothetical protein